MPTKAELYAQMAEKVTTQLTGSWQEWAGFLTTASRLYKYPFHEQLMIYAQRPDAIACAEYDLWNEKMGRYVRRGSKGIALVDDSATVKTFYKENGHFRLQPENSSMDPIILDQVEILGKVIGLFRFMN